VSFINERPCGYDMADLIKPQFIQEMWPTLADMTYLNNASTGIPPKTTVEAMKRFLENRVHALGDFQETLALYREIRENLATLLGGEYHQYGFVPSTSSGINSFAHSIEYPQGSNIVLCDLEFPANYIPWQNVRNLYGPELRVVKSNDGAAPVESFAEKIDENTRVVAVSQIQFGTGYRIELERLAKVAHEHGALLSVDVIQAAGCFDADLPRAGVDFATGQAAKWMLGPIGAGYVFVGKPVMDELKPRFLGWWGVEELWEFGYFERTPLPDARKFQVGSPTAIAYVGLLESLKILLQIPSRNRRQKALENANYLRKRLEEMRIPYYEFGPDNNSATVSAAPEGVEEIQQGLMKNRIICSVRNGRLRISPHFYNSTAEIDTLLDHLG
jgi:cysteine desulfurase/selenocysteine lyase